MIMFPPMQVSATETVLGVKTDGGTVLVASAGFAAEDFAKVVDTLHKGSDVDLNQVEHLETEQGSAIWWIPPHAVNEPQTEEDADV